ncbi:hypothetical protein PQX77_006603 [Marasmius sp. AFHP31]|nr:hypothetical protein PQX77_006603 [Marasmius sp. AFHP31]
MPSEILAIIFKFHCETDVIKPWELPAALGLTRICGRWRDIALSTPSIWSFIWLDFSDWQYGFHKLHQLTDYYGSKSQNSPLTLTLTVAPAHDFDFAPLIRQCERWKDVSLLISPYTFPSALFQPIRNHLPLLTTLPSTCHDELKSWQDVPLALFDNCSSLSSLRIDDTFALKNTEVLQRDQVKTLRINVSCDTHACSLSPRDRAVETLDLFPSGGKYVCDGNHCDHVVAGHVESLRILGVSGQCDVDDALRHTTLSNLSALTIVGDWVIEPPSWTGTLIQDFVLRSGCTITYLHLQSLLIDDLQVLSLLTSLPTVKSLCIVEMVIHDENRIVTKTLLDGLTVSGPLNAPSLPLLPHLTEMKLMVHAQNLPSETLLGVLSSRWAPDPIQATELGVNSLSFVAITVFSNTTPPERLLDCLQCFKAAGMKLVITYAELRDIIDNDLLGLVPLDGVVGEAFSLDPSPPTRALAFANSRSLTAITSTRGFDMYGLTDHVPRYRHEDLYPESNGRTRKSLLIRSEASVEEAHRLKSLYASQITLLIGLETEFISPLDLERLEDLLKHYHGRIEYIVGSVHHVDRIPIDFDFPTYEKALRVHESGRTEHERTESFLCSHFEPQFTLLKRFQPDIVGHVDLCCLYTPSLRLSTFTRAWDMLRRNVKYAIEYGGLFEVNAAAFRKNRSTAYPGEIIVAEGGRFALSDDSHGPHAVGLNHDRMADYLKAKAQNITETWHL